MFIALEGIDGCGKTTQTDMLGEWLLAQGREVHVARDPGTTPAGKQIREILLHKDVTLQPITQMLLFSAARSELAHQIKQWLDAGGDVIVDRWYLSTLVYQHHVQGVDAKLIQAIHRETNYGVWPDLHIVIDVEVVQAMRRKAQLPPDLGSCSAPTQAPTSMAPLRAEQRDRFEREGPDFREKLRAGYLKEVEIAQPFPHKVVRIDGSYSPEVLHELIRDLCAEHIPEFASLLSRVAA